MNATSTGVSAEPEWTQIIEPEGRLFDLKLGELWHYRDLISLFVRRDFVSVYKQTVLGPLWYIIQPIMTTLIFTVIFGRIAKLSTDGLPQFLFYLSGTIIWTYFSDCLTKTSNTFITNAQLFGKVYFPRLAVPISILISNLITFSIQFVLFIGFLVYYMLKGANVHPHLWVLITPVLLIMMAGLGLGFGIFVSSLTTRYRDLRFLVTFGVQLWMYITPVIYPVSSIPERLRPLIQANPLTPILEAFRYAYMGSGTVNLANLAYTAIFTIVVLVVGVLSFNRVEATFMDTV